MIFVWIFFSTLFIALISLIGAVFFIFNKKLLDNILFLLISFSAGVFMGGAFLHLLPEALEQLDALIVFILLISGFSLFFLLEKVIMWRHCHKENCEHHPFTYLTLIGDSIHNFIDGVIIAASFMINIPLGIATTISVFVHEVPQGIGNLSVLIYGGFSRKKALFLNFISALTIIIGGIISYFIFSESQKEIVYLLPLTAGTFLYIASSDLIPELNKEVDVKKSFVSFLVFLIGVIIMFLLKIKLG